MYPIVWEPFGFPISSFGVMLALAFLVGTWITAVRMREEGLDPEAATTILIYVMVGGIGGSKLYFAIDNAIRHDTAFLPLLLSRDGITWYGGLIGATALGALGCRIHGISILKFMNAAAVAGPVGQALGRIGCFLVGDDYGRPSDLPWAIAFPKGAPPTQERVHPTQLYEVLWLLPVAALLWTRRKRSPFLFGEYLALNGLGRLVIESWRINPKVALGLTEPQWIGLALIAVGSVSWLYYRANPRPQPA
ncbi:MAG TPA: prolipoprotein diacylglyceryl transferase [Myxococcota bacterium]|jgi:phosphatidylglycerol:prolipoprotein diacylglycerol transferase|nr:prolipoprotein diacylglyceryl transferase [Myxococcota bacterium]